MAGTRKTATGPTPRLSEIPEIDRERTQYALSWFVDHGAETDIEVWATHVAAWEHETDLAGVDRSKREHLYSWLYFELVPRLVEDGLVEHTAEADGSFVRAVVPSYEFERRTEGLLREQRPADS
ncbi:DUF7344 domain-containing protein [Haloarchaeobius sp. DFWS5]|uniref:DUF7344 domain-containing protein n=1 Tax=Haloarchaeobius sp. DFWS5 TaxID=3446114 RepID=UPI003EBA554F